MSDEIMDFSNETVQIADELALQIAAKAIEDARAALKKAYQMEEEKDAAGQLLSAILAVENAEVAGVAKSDDHAEMYMRESAEIMQKAVMIMVGLIVKSMKNQDDDEMEGFCIVTEIFGEITKAFNLNQQLQNSNVLIKSANDVRKSISKMSPNAFFMNIRLSRIIDGMQKAAYIMMRSAGTEVISTDNHIGELLLIFGGAMDAAESEFQNAKLARRTVRFMISDTHLNAAEDSFKITTARQNIKEMKKSLGAMKKECNVITKIFDKLVRAVAKKEQDSALAKSSTAGTGQHANDDVYMQQRTIVALQRDVKNMLEGIYNLEKDIAVLKLDVAKAVKIQSE